MMNLVLANNVENDYTLLARVKDDGTVYEYVVAWCFKPDGTWGQGHYFSADDLSEAMVFMKKQKLIDKVVEIMTHVDESVDEDTPFNEIKDIDCGEYLRTLIEDAL